MKRSREDEAHGGPSKKRKVTFGNNTALADELKPAAPAAPSPSPFADPSGLPTGVTSAPVISAHLTNDELIDLERSGDLDAIKRYKQTLGDDMDRLSYLDSAKNRVFEADREKSMKGKDEDDIFGDSDEEMAEGGEEEDDEDEVEQFHTREEEREDFFTDTTVMGKFKEEREEERAEETEDSWYFEHQRKQDEGEGEEGERAIERMGMRKPKKVVDKGPDRMRTKYEGADVSDIFKVLVGFLQEGETVAAAIRRLGTPPGGKAKRRGSQQQRRKRKLAGEEGGEDPSEKEARVKAMEDVTSLAELCMEEGVAAIYSHNRAWLLREVGKKEGTSNGNEEASKVQWEYQAKDGGAVFGPHTSQQMLEWQTAGFFDENNPLPVRQVGSRDWLPSTTVDFAAFARREAADA